MVLEITEMTTMEMEINMMENEKSKTDIMEMVTMKVIIDTTRKWK